MSPARQLNQTFTNSEGAPHSGRGCAGAALVALPGTIVCWAAILWALF